MPTYEYNCKSCGANFEVFIKSADKNSVTCPECRSRSLQEVYRFNLNRGGSPVQNACETCPGVQGGIG
ncbi:MAG: zinc ribbon domain-containing protein [Firmicutes bacterium]|nr:zinc ribbon domain-containing protein [Bacillota bacterium]